MKNITGGQFEITTSDKNGRKEEGRDVKEEMEQFFARTKEKPDVASLMVRIDRAKLDQEIAEVDDEGGKGLLELFRKLPEDLNFQPGKTLIIGDNATGKSTLAKALFMAGKKEKVADDIREMAAGLNREDSFINADESAEKQVFEPNVGYWAEFNRSSGLAPKLGKAIAVNEFLSSSPTVEYADFHEIIGRIKNRYDGMGITSDVANDMFAAGTVDRHAYRRNVNEARERHLKKVSAMSKEMGSARQTVEKNSNVLIHGDNNEPGPGVYFLDEPESGISPMRHKRIIDNIDDMVGAKDTHQGSIIIIPTNSLVLFESDLPRIDLRYPERGIFQPSQYPGYFED